jgi:hypothetical protein
MLTSWQRLVAWVRALARWRENLGEHWVEPSNQVTRAVLSGALGGLPPFEPVAAAAVEVLAPFEAAPASAPPAPANAAPATGEPERPAAGKAA